MKSILLLALIMVAANSYTLWDNWHNVPSKWVPSPSNAVSDTYGLPGWTRNSPATPHDSGMFSDYSQVFTQYLYWKTSDSRTLIICGPKYYLFSETLCKVDPYFKKDSMPTYCLPNYFNYDGQGNNCNEDNLLLGTHTCCYENAIKASPFFEKDMTSVDPYSTPLW